MDSMENGGDEVRVTTLLVKAPDQRINDQIVKCKLDWTVARLKDHLAHVYPSKPKREEQKIIFSGQLLNDSMILKDVLQQYYNKDDHLFTVHLVCGGQSKFSPTEKTTMSNANGGTVQSGTSAPSTTESAQTAQPAQSTQSTPIQQYYSQLNNQQMAWMQQAYTHYLTQYMQLMAAQGIQLQSASPSNAQSQNASAANDNHNYHNNNNINNNNNNTIANNNNATATNNNNGEENDDARAGIEAVGAAPQPGQEIAGDANAANNNAPADEAVGAALNRDWLDIFDMLSRIVVLSSIVYFYSSPSRFLIVTFLGFAIYLIQGGFFRGQAAFLAENNNARVENNNQEEQNDAAPAARPPPFAQQPPRIPTATPDPHGDAARTNLNEDNERPGAWAFTWTFFSSFFASLIPDQPNVI